MMPAERLDGVTLSRLIPRDAAGRRVPDRPVAGIALDSRAVVPGGAFVALAGHATHGVRFLDDALAGGAAAVLHDAGDRQWTAAADAQCVAAGATAVPVAGLAARLGSIAAIFHGEPAGALESVTAVTGTDGKTSVTHYVAAMLDDPDAPAGVLGTLGRGRPGAAQGGGLTTPDAVAVQGAFADLVAQGVQRVALEASSHGLAQHRLDGTPIDVAVLTQLGRDHLDYHADAEAYAAAKARLFHWPGLSAAVLNADDAFGRRLQGEVAGSVRIVTYGRGEADLTARHVRCEPDGIAFELAAGAEDARAVRIPLLGEFNVDNVLAAAGALVALGHGFDDVVSRIGRIRPVPGRMELFRGQDTPGVVVDYAHNAGALEAALAALRSHSTGRVWCIFGAGGDRDRGKRPLMGAAAAAGADGVVVTDDNPRSEDPRAIVADILEGLPRGTEAQVEHDRGRALERTLAQADPADLILLAGKGHETTQTRSDGVHPWSDRDAARRALGLHDGGDAP